MKEVTINYYKCTNPEGEYTYVRVKTKFASIEMQPGVSGKNIDYYEIQNKLEKIPKDEVPKPDLDYWDLLDIK
jgi:hypothetical protein